jgi:hypothetical protein
MKNDDGRLWTLGAIGLLAVAGSVARRRGSGARRFVDFVRSEDPLNDGGGIVFRNDYDEFVIETWDALNGFPDEMIRQQMVKIGRPDLDPTDAEVEDLYPFEVSQVIVYPDLAGEYGWIDWGEVSDSLGMGDLHLQELAVSPHPLRRSEALVAAIQYYGSNEFDSYPIIRTGAELKERWPQLRGMTKRISFRGETMVPRRRG